MPLFLIFIIFNNHSHSTIIHSFIIHHSPRPVFLYPQQEKNLHEVPSPRIELGPALQQADALPTEPRRTLLSHAAPYWATPHRKKLTLNHFYVFFFFFENTSSLILSCSLS
jgi:hypothetical protein